MHSGVYYFPLRHNDVDTIMTVDAAKWNCADGDISSCVTNIILLDHVSYYSEHFGTNLPVDPFILSCFMYLYIYLCFLCIVVCLHSFIQHIYL